MSEETRSLRPLVRFSTALARLLPDETSGRARVLLLRAAGWRIARTSYLAGVPTWSGSGPIRDRLEVGQQCFINLGCHFELSDTVQIGDLVAIGHQVLVLTSTHEIGAAEHRSSTLTTAPVVIEAGSWIGARATILPGVTIGTGSDRRGRGRGHEKCGTQHARRGHPRPPAARIVLTTSLRSGAGGRCRAIRVPPQSSGSERHVLDQLDVDQGIGCRSNACEGDP